MGCLAAAGLTAIVVALGAAMSGLVGVFMTIATSIATGVIGLVAFLLLLI
jgi:hypothetical protein